MSAKEKVELLTKYKNGELIHMDPPRALCRRALAWYSGTLFIMVSFTTSYFMIAALGALYVIWFFTYVLWFFDVWKSVGYRRRWLIAAALGAGTVGFFGGQRLTSLLADLIKGAIG